MENEGKSELWSAGKSSYGQLGQGTDNNSSDEFKSLDYDKENIVFKDVCLGFDHALAITTEGELYGWGRNEEKQLGMSDTKNYWSPTKIPYFENYYAREIKCGRYHSAVKVSPKGNRNKIMYLHLGDNNGCDNESKTDEGILHLHQFDKGNINYWNSGYRNLFFYYDGEEKGSSNVGIHHGYTCDVTGQTPIEGTMHFYKDDEKVWHFLSREGYEKQKSALPDIVYATKYYIESIQTKEWPEIDADSILEETKEHHEPEYRAYNSIDNEMATPGVKTNEIEIFEKESHDINPLIFYRLSRPLKDNKYPPELNLEKYHEKSKYYGIRIEADPDYSFMKNEIIMELERDRYMNIQDRIKNFDDKYDEELNKQIENNLEMMQQNFVECPYVFLIAGEIEFEDPGLRMVPSESVQSRIDSLVMFNQYLLKSLPFLCFEEELIFEKDKGNTILQTESLTA